MVAIGVLGVNHKTADLGLREAIARVAREMHANPFFPYPIVLLSTCNRTEIYFSGEDLAAVQSHLLSFFRKQIDALFEQAFYSFFGIDCFFHLCKVAAGLDSAIFAESEIQRQVKLAYANEKDLPFAIHFVFQKALKISKEIRSKREPKSSPSLYNALWRLTDWQNRNILLVGYSQINQGLLSFLIHKGISAITLCTRTAAKVHWEGIRIGDRNLLNQWQDYEIIVCAAEADRYLIEGQTEKKAVIFDLSVPRNVNPNVNAKIYNIEEIHHWILKQQENGDLLEKDESIIWQNVIRLTKIYRAKKLFKTQRVLDNAGMGSHL